jgi:hypothetical protein
MFSGLVPQMIVLIFSGGREIPCNKVKNCKCQINITGANSKANVFSILLGILSGPGDFVVLMRRWAE